MKIHPTAIIDRKRNYMNSEVGPYSIIEGDVQIGEGSWIESCVRIYSGTRMGKFNKVHITRQSLVDSQDISFKPETKTYTIIGDNNTFRRHHYS